MSEAAPDEYSYMPDAGGEPWTIAGKRLLDIHGHRMNKDHMDAWCMADDEPWPCPFSQSLADIEREAARGGPDT